MLKHYIASAGTGKTFSLVNEVLKKVIDENIPLDRILILTFTEKAGQELKERIIKSLKTSIKNTSLKQEKIKIHKQLLLNSHYIGTFHSIFFSILKKYPQYSHIDNSYEILSEDLEIFFDEAFNIWIEQDYQENKNLWKDIIDNFSYYDLRKNFFYLYNNRLKISQYVDLSDLESQKKQIVRLSKQLEETLKELLSSYSSFLDKVRYRFDGFRNSPYEILSKIKEKNYTQLPSEKAKTVLGKESFLFKAKKNKEFINLLETYYNKVYPLDEKIGQLTLNLKATALDYNAKLLLNRFYSFLSFIQNLKKDEKKLDFNDILEKTLYLLEEETVLKEIKNQFKYIFIDEFQDTDSYQIKIIQKIMDNNLYIFADPKQCIYTWRDADINEYLSFVERCRFKHESLTKNFRSAPELVNFYNRLTDSDKFLSHLNKKYKQPIICANPENFSDKNSYVKIFNIKYKEKLNQSNLIEKEALFSIKLIKDLLSEGYSLDDIMFLFRTNEDLNAFLKVFIRYNIPVITNSNENIFSQPEIKQIIDILSFIEYPEDSLLLLKVLKSPLFLISDKELYRYKDNLSLDIFNTKEAELLKNLIDKKYDLSLYEIIGNLLDNTNILEFWALHPDGTQRLLNIDYLITVAQKLSLKGFSLRDFIIYSQTAHIDIPNLPDKKAVRFLTMHKSKGLQSKVVIIPLLSIRPGSSRLGGIHIYEDNPVLNLKNAKSIEFDTYKPYFEENEKNESERLFYVAITRAEEKLILLTTQDTKKSSNTYQALLKEALPDYDSYIENVNFSLEEINFFEQNKEESKLEELVENLKKLQSLEKKLKQEKEKALKEKKFITVSELMKEEESKYFSSSKDSEIPLYVGTVIHYVLENIDFKDYSFEKALNIANQMANNIPVEIREDVFKLVQELLYKFENSKILKELQRVKIIEREMPFTLEEDGKFIEGRIDLICEYEGKIVIIDYKTNRYETESQLENIKQKYKTQKNYYIKALKKLFPDKEIEFKLALLWKDDLIPI